MTEDTMVRVAGVLLCLFILGAMAIRLWRGWKMLSGKPKSYVDQLNDETDDIKRLNEKNREI